MRWKINLKIKRKARDPMTHTGERRWRDFLLRENLYSNSLVHSVPTHQLIHLLLKVNEQNRSRN